ncbi:hypothetical protein ABZ512_13495 [Nocardiopsis dassonvillei]|uniref:hypothetical protein n=1 Tax=Nocardiopsis dassonvillei TaxID=2014 RepID=UPI0033F31E3B
MTKPRWNVLVGWSLLFAYVFLAMWFFTNLLVALGQMVFLALLVGLGRWNRRSKHRRATSLPAEESLP